VILIIREKIILIKQEMVNVVLEWL